MTVAQLALPLIERRMYVCECTVCGNSFAQPSVRGRARRVCESCFGVSKRCASCRHVKPVTSFARHSCNRDGFHSWCKPCVLSKKQTPEAKAKARIRDAANRLSGRTRDRELRRLYGITLEQYDALLKAQGYQCSICGRSNARGQSPSTFHVDHDHSTGAVRGLLCDPCNRGLGLLGDTAGGLRKALAYLELSEAPCLAN